MFSGSSPHSVYTKHNHMKCDRLYFVCENLLSEIAFLSMVSWVWGTARSHREPYQESKEPGIPQESGFLPKKSESRARNFAATLFTAKSLVRIECAKKVLMSTSSEISQIVTWWSHITTATTLVMIWSFWLIEGWPEHGWLSTDVQPPLNLLYHSLIRVMPIPSSLKGIWIFWMVSTWLSLSFWQNLMQ